MTEPRDPSPGDDALAYLGKLIASGTSPERITHDIGALIAGWAVEPDMDPGAAQARIERLWDSISKDAADLQEQIADAREEDAGWLSAARRVLTAMNAVVAALAEAHGRV